MASDTNGVNSIKLPVIDISPWLSTNSDNVSSEINNEATQLLRTETVEKVKHACETVGFFIVQVPNNLQEKSALFIKNAAESARIFFKERNQCKRLQCAAKKGDTIGAYGYFPMLSESLGYVANVDKRPDIREAFSMGPILPLSERLQEKLDSAKKRLEGSENTDKQQKEADECFCNVMDFCYEPTPWPHEHPSKNEVNATQFQEDLCHFYEFTSKIALITSKIMAQALDLDENHFTEACSDGEHCNSARAIWYPKITDDYEIGENQMRCGAHSDTGLLTLL